MSWQAGLCPPHIAASPGCGTTPVPPPLQPPPEDPGELRLALYRLQRQNLKLTSKLDRAREEAGERWELPWPCHAGFRCHGLATTLSGMPLWPLCPPCMRSM